MEISKVKNSFDDYKIEQITHRQLTALKDSLAKSVGADTDEIRANLEWSLERLPRPGQEEDEDADSAVKSKADEKPKAAKAPDQNGEFEFSPVAARDATGHDLDLDRGGAELSLPDLPDPDDTRGV